MTKVSIAVYGASGFGREVMPILAASPNPEVSGAEMVFVDDVATGQVNGWSVVPYVEWIRRPGMSRFASIAVADPEIRKRLAWRCEADGVAFVEVRHPSVVQLDAVVIGCGAILCPFVTITSNVKIGKHFHCNLYSYVAHDCVIGDFVTFAPAVKCNGNVVVEDGVYVGTGAVIKQGRTGAPIVLGRGAVIGMGAVVTRSVPAGVTVVGNPAKPLVR